MSGFSLRRSLLYVPGNMPSMLQNIPIFNSDCVMIDLEDAVPYSEKMQPGFWFVIFLKITKITIKKFCPDQ